LAQRLPDVERGEKENYVNQGALHSGQEVRFRLGDLICPDLEQVLAEVGPDVDVNGRIVFLSDRGHEKEHFAIVSVGGIASPVIVPVRRLRTSREIQVDHRAAV
jgi:hypothetical protein